MWPCHSASSMPRPDPSCILPCIKRAVTPAGSRTQHLRPQVRLTLTHHPAAARSTIALHRTATVRPGDHPSHPHPLLPDTPCQDSWGPRCSACTAQCHGAQPHARRQPHGCGRGSGVEPSICPRAPPAGSPPAEETGGRAASGSASTGTVGVKSWHGAEGHELTCPKNQERKMLFIGCSDCPQWSHSPAAKDRSPTALAGVDLVTPPPRVPGAMKVTGLPKESGMAAAGTPRILAPSTATGACSGVLAVGQGGDAASTSQTIRFPGEVAVPDDGNALDDSQPGYRGDRGDGVYVRRLRDPEPVRVTLPVLQRHEVEVGNLYRRPDLGREGDGGEGPAEPAAASEAGDRGQQHGQRGTSCVPPALTQ